MKKLLLIPGLLFSVCTFASPCDNSTLQIINNSDIPVVVGNVEAGIPGILHGGTIRGIQSNQIIDAHSNVTAFISSGRGSKGMASGHIGFITQTGRLTMKYSLSANPFGWASTCKVKGTVQNIDNFGATVNITTTTGSPGNLRLEINNSSN